MLAQLRYRGRVRNQRELERKFRAYRLSGEGDFRVTYWTPRTKPLSELKMGQAGKVKLRGAPHLLMLDIDNKTRSTTRIFKCLRSLGLRARWVRYDKTARGWHVIVSLYEKLKPAEIVALQAVLGSDWRREMFNLCRVLSGKAARNWRWNLLFEYKI